MSKSPPTIKPSDEVPTEILADSIVAIADGVRRLRAGRLNDKALYLLIQNAAPMRKGGRGRAPARLATKDIRAVLDGIESLSSTYLK